MNVFRNYKFHNLIVPVFGAKLPTWRALGVVMMTAQIRDDPSYCSADAMTCMVIHQAQDDFYTSIALEAEEPP